MNNKKQMINVTAFNGQNVLLKLVSFFEKRGFQIQSINLFKTEKADVTRFNFMVLGEKMKLKRSCNQLFKYVETIDVEFKKEAR